MVSPKPVPLIFITFLALKKRVNIYALSPSGIPIPLSFTSIIKFCLSVWEIKEIICPSSRLVWLVVVISNFCPISLFLIQNQWNEKEKTEKQNDEYTQEHCQYGRNNENQFLQIHKWQRQISCGQFSKIVSNTTRRASIHGQAPRRALCFFLFSHCRHDWWATSKPF